ncbi:MAG: hypothetical protein ACSHYA_10765 [Opitutaceae bacterium]
MKRLKILLPLLVTAILAIISLKSKWPELEFWYHTKNTDPHWYYYYYGQPSVDRLTYDKEGNLSGPPSHLTGGQVHSLLVCCYIPKGENPYEWKPSIEFVNQDIQKSIESHGFPVVGKIGSNAKYKDLTNPRPAT